MKKIVKVLFIFLLLFVSVSQNVYADISYTEFGSSSNSTSTSFENVESCNLNGGIPTKCGIPAGLADMIHDIYDLLKIAVPIVLVIMGMIDLLKAVAGQKEDDIKKGWNALVKRTLYGVLVFFVFTTVQLIVSLLPGDNTKITGCVKEFFTGDGGTFKCIMDGANTGK